MNEVRLYYDKERRKEINETIQFEPVMAGKDNLKTIYIFNSLRYIVNFAVEVVGPDVEVVGNQVGKLMQGEAKDVILKISPKVTALQPIKAIIDIKINYVVT